MPQGYCGARDEFPFTNSWSTRGKGRLLPGPIPTLSGLATGASLVRMQNISCIAPCRTQHHTTHQQQSHLHHYLQTLYHTATSQLAHEDPPYTPTNYSLPSQHTDVMPAYIQRLITLTPSTALHDHQASKLSTSHPLQHHLPTCPNLNFHDLYRRPSYATTVAYLNSMHVERPSPDIRTRTKWVIDCQSNWT